MFTFLFYEVWKVQIIMQKFGLGWDVAKREKVQKGRKADISCGQL